jgi:hypothetical protein
MTRNTDPANEGTIGELVDILGVAREIARELCEDPLLGRLMAVFQAMPLEDRPTIIGVLEREILGRHLSRGTEKPVGQATHVNPHARLYVSHETQLDSRHFDCEQMHVANARHAHRPAHPARAGHLRALEGGAARRHVRSGRDRAVRRPDARRAGVSRTLARPSRRRVGRSPPPRPPPPVADERPRRS